MSSPTKAHRDMAVALVRTTAARRALDRGEFALNKLAQAFVDIEATAYARGLADGAERERAAIKTWLDGESETLLADYIEHGQHLAGESE